MEHLIEPLEKLKTEIEEKVDLPDHLRREMLADIQSAIELRGEPPSADQDLSNRFYSPNNTNSLHTGDLISLARLNDELTKKHEKRYYRESFGDTFYPYFFKSYEYAVVATQCCKIEQQNCHVIELCAVKSIDKVASSLLTSGHRTQRNIVIYDNDLTKIHDQFRRLADQQLDQYFFYPAHCSRNEVKSPALVACIEVKIPIRVAMDHSETNLQSIINAKERSIAPIFRSKLSEKLGRFYINVALEDNKDLFLNEDKFEEWIKNNLKGIFYFDPTKTLKQPVADYVSKNFGNMTYREIYEDPNNFQKILDFITSRSSAASN